MMKTKVYHHELLVLGLNTRQVEHQPRPEDGSANPESSWHTLSASLRIRAGTRVWSSETEKTRSADIRAMIREC
jgi:hypothetical protein